MNKIYNYPKFRKRLFFLNKSQKWSKYQHEKNQLYNLRKLYNYVKKNVPFYKDYFSGRKNFKIKTLDDLKKFPVIDKNFIKNNYKKFLSVKMKKDNTFSRTTGGSTGNPLTILSDLNFQINDKANTFHYLSIFKKNIKKNKSVRLYGDKIPQQILRKKKYWYKKNQKQLIMSAFHINSSSIKSYVKVLQDFQPEYIHSRSSIMFLMASLILKEQIKFNLKLENIFVDGEYLTSGQRKFIEKIFKCRLINIYGHTEGALVGFNCEFSNKMHFMPQNGIIEILDSKNNNLKKEKSKGIITATGFNNYMMPMIRYKTGDVASIGKKKCKCKRNYFFVDQVEGRLQDYVLDKKSNLIPLAPAIFNYNDMDWKKIENYKVVQYQKGKIIIQVQLYLKTKNEREVLNTISKKLKKILPNFIIKIQKVKKIERNTIGKQRYLDQKIKII